MSSRINGHSRRAGQPAGGAKRWLRSRAIIFITLAVFLIVCFTLGRELLRRQSVSRDVERLQSEISSLEKQNTELGQLLAYLKSPIYLEEEARLKLGLKKSGESVVAVPPESAEINSVNTDSSSNSSRSAGSESTENNPRKWWRYLWRQVD